MLAVTTQAKVFPFGKGKLHVTIVARNAVRVQYAETETQSDLPDWLYVKHGEVDSKDVKVEVDSRRQVLTVKEQYDFILLDCPPSLGLITLNAITASTDVIVPLIAEVLPFKGLKMINNFVNLIHTRLNKAAHVTGILITRWESTNLSKSIEQELRKAVGDLVFQTKIRKNVSVAEAPFEYHNIVEYAPKSNGAVDYQSFVTELVKKLGV